MRHNWIAVACAEHARRGCALPERGFVQVCHGKCAPLQRLAAGDRVAYYAPTLTLGGKDKCQSLVSIGLVREGEPYSLDMGGGFVPYRRDVRYVPAREVSILPLLDRLDFVEDRARWGYKFRFGFFPISEGDMRTIAQAMQAAPEALHFS